MPQIKGPIYFKKDEGIPNNVLEAIGGVRLPFTATNFKYSNRALDGKGFTFSDGSKMVANTGVFKKAIELEPIGDANL